MSRSVVPPTCTKDDFWLEINTVESLKVGLEAFFLNCSLRFPYFLNMEI